MDDTTNSLKEELKFRLNVTNDWDKYDYQTQRYSFDDVYEVLESIINKSYDNR